MHAHSYPVAHVTSQGPRPTTHCMRLHAMHNVNYVHLYAILRHQLLPPPGRPCARTGWSWRASGSCSSPAGCCCWKRVLPAALSTPRRRRLLPPLLPLNLRSRTHAWRWSVGACADRSLGMRKNAQQRRSEGLTGCCCRQSFREEQPRVAQHLGVVAIREARERWVGRSRGREGVAGDPCVGQRRCQASVCVLLPK